jgi:hypothetical protein
MIIQLYLVYLDSKQLELLYIIDIGAQNGTSTLEKNNWQLLMHPSYDVAIPFLDSFSRQMKAHVPTKTSTRIFLAATFIIGRN